VAYTSWAAGSGGAGEILIAESDDFTTILTLDLPESVWGTDPETVVFGTLGLINRGDTTAHLNCYWAGGFHVAKAVPGEENISLMVTSQGEWHSNQVTLQCKVGDDHFPGTPEVYVNRAALSVFPRIG
jgi:hypothetical protein